MKTKFFSALFALLFCSTAFAEGFYVGGGVGFVQLEASDSGIDFDANTFGWRVLGGYEINDNFAVEAAYFDTGDAKDTILGTDVELTLDGFILSGLAMLPLNDAITLFGKLGYYDADAKASVGGFSASDSDSGILLGGGARFDFNDNLGLRGEFDWFDSDDTIWSLGVTLQYTFTM